MLLGQNMASTHRRNRSLIIRIILQQPGLSRANLAEITGLTPASITHITAGLLRDEWIVEDPEVRSQRTVGRPAIGVRVSRGRRYIGAVHLQRRLVSVGLVELDGAIRAQVQETLDERPDPGGVADLIAKLFAKVQTQVSPKHVIGVGVGASGLVDYLTSTIRIAPGLGWFDVRLGAWLYERLGLPVVVDNNTRGMALAEYLMGRERQARWIVFLYAGQGTASGVWAGDRMFRGAHGIAGEVGHTSVDMNGEVCWCGNRGCLELYLGEQEIRRHLQIGDMDNISSALIKATEERRDWIERLVVTALVNIINAYNPDVIVVGGWIDQAWGILGTGVMEQVKRRTKFWPSSVRVVQSSFGPEIGLVGAAAVGLGQMVCGVGEEEWRAGDSELSVGHQATGADND